MSSKSEQFGRGFQVRRKPVATALSDRYKYEALPSNTGHIRIMTLLPGATETIECRLSILSVEKAKSNKSDYDALSYMWGAPDELGLTIKLEGKRFPVRENLWQALYHLRRPGVARVLWIDAICINQEDDVERGRQIQQMCHIYRKATCVQVWLGPENHCHGYWKFFEDIEGSEGCGVGCHDNNRSICNIINRCDSEGTLASALEIFEHPYWYRLWILQETVMATYLQLNLGQVTLQWTIVMKAFSSMIVNKHDHVSKGAKTTLSRLSRSRAAMIQRRRGERLGIIAPVKHYKDAKFPVLTSVVRLSYAALCSDPRDRLYGLLGMINNPQIPIDYKKSMFQIYCDMLPLVRHLEVPDPGCYVVHLSQLAQQILRGPHPVPENISSFVECVTLIGVGACKITSIGPQYDRNTFNDKAATVAWLQLYEQRKRHVWSFLAWLNQQEYGSSFRYEVEQDTQDIPVPIRQIVKPITSQYFSLKSESKARRRELPHRNFQKLRQAKISSRPLESVEPTAQLPRFFKSFPVGVGLAPMEARIGDIICRFHESDVVAIIRKEENNAKHDNEPASYRLIGRALIFKQEPKGVAPRKSRSNRNVFNFHGQVLTGHRLYNLENLWKDYVEIDIDIETLQELTILH